MKLDSKPAELIDVAMGSQPADYYIKDARVLNVFTGELIDKVGVAVKGSYISLSGLRRGNRFHCTRENS